MGITLREHPGGIVSGTLSVYNACMGLTEAESAAVRRLRDLLVERFGARDVKLFGSAVRGTMDPESDIDLFVAVPHMDWDTELAMYDAAFDAGLEIDRPISLTVFTSHELESSPLRASGIVRRIQQEGMPV
jgi:predicted nucleotidyltransferase